tara:strand:- start:1417 stop:1743 length:327 start_codon:yes stop_codon:yes gene_type:complete
MSKTEMYQNAWQNKNLDELKKDYFLMAQKLEARRATCRKSSKQYYDKTYKLKENATASEVEKNKSQLQKRDEYQKTYYDKNKETIKVKQKKYREVKKAKKLAEIVTTN